MIAPADLGAAFQPVSLHQNHEIGSQRPPAQHEEPCSGDPIVNESTGSHEQRRIFLRDQSSDKHHPRSFDGGRMKAGGIHTASGRDPDPLRRDPFLNQRIADRLTQRVHDAGQPKGLPVQTETQR